MLDLGRGLSGLEPVEPGRSNLNVAGSMISSSSSVLAVSALTLAAARCLFSANGDAPLGARGVGLV